MFYIRKKDLFAIISIKKKLVHKEDLIVLRFYGLTIVFSKSRDYFLKIVMSAMKNCDGLFGKRRPRDLHFSENFILFYVFNHTSLARPGLNHLHKLVTPRYWEFLVLEMFIVL